MNRAELKQALETSEMPASEIGAYALSLIEQLDPPCPHWSSTGCSVIDVCTCEHEVFEP